MLLAAVVVRQYFLDALECLGKDLSSCPQFEERVLEFDQDIQKMLEVGFTTFITGFIFSEQLHSSRWESREKESYVMIYNAAP